MIKSSKLRSHGDVGKGGLITIKPYNKLAKDKNISLGIEVTPDYIKKNKK